MRLAEILLAFHNMPACDRLDLICRMLRHCVPHELRFLGTVLTDATREHYKNLVQGELNANRVNHFSGFKDTGVTHEVCEKLCSALAVVHADNRPVAEMVFNLLDDQRVLKLCEETTDLKILEDYRLLYIMAVNHPALSFNQKLHLTYTYLQRLDAIFSEKCRCNFSGSFSSSAEKSYNDGELRYPPEASIKQPGPDTYMVRCEVHSVYKRVSDKRYVFMVQVEWSDGTQNTVRRTYGDFFSFQNKLLDLFPKEAGHKHKSERIIPYLPGKKLLTPRTNRETAEKRLPELARYTRELIGLSEHITHSPHVLEFFRPREMDQKEEYPPSHKITTLYDVLESKSRHPSAPAALFQGSPTHSPVPVRRPSPLHRLITFGGDSPPSSSSSSSVQGSRTLPHSIPTSIQGPKKDEKSQLERRSTFPTHRSAFTPVVASTQSQATSAGSSLTNSHPSIATPPMASNSPSPSLSASSFSASSTGAPPTTTARSHSSPFSSNSSLTNVVIANHVSLPHTSSCMASSSSMSYRDSTSTTTASTATITAAPLPRPNLQSGITTSAGSLVSSQATEVNQTTTPISTPAAAVSQSQSRPETQSQTHGVAPAMRIPVMSVSQTSVVTAARSTVAQTSPTTTTTTTPVVSSPSLLSPPVSHVQAPILPRPPTVTPSPPHSGASTPRDPYANSQAQLLQLASLGPVHYLPSVSPVTPYSPAVYTMYGSPVSSPLASPKTNRWYASHNCLARTPTEYDSLFKWLKGLRLHKYSPLFENVTFEELCSFSLEQLKEKGMTAGAAKKLRIKAEELKRANFTGFRDMPFASGMSRKPSTCSLPAALLMERGMTPSSSCEGFSPEGSTCSLDQSGHKRAASATVGTNPYDSKRDSSGSDVPPVIASFDAAIVKVVPAKVNGEVSGTSMSSSGFDASVGESPARIVNGPAKDSPSLRSASPRITNAYAGRRPRSTTPNRSATDSRTANGSFLKRSSAGSNWADDVPGDSGGAVNRPEWAHMHSGGQIRQENLSGTTSPFHQMLTTHPFPATGNPTAMRHSQAIKRHSGETYSTSVIQVPSTPNHKPTQKDSGYLESSPLIAVPPSLLGGVPPTTMSPRHANVAMSINAANWPSPSRPLVPTARSSRPHPQQQQNPYVNGLVWTSTPQMGGARLPAPHPGGLMSYPGGLANHGRNSHPVSCFNCGKRGHRGNACPGETMETKSPDAFHKQLERMARSNAANSSQETV